jgi:hypothetical protein
MYNEKEYKRIFIAKLTYCMILVLLILNRNKAKKVYDNTDHIYIQIKKK